MVLAEAVYALTSQLPPEERFGLVSQMRRAAVSVSSCIAEGNARESTRDYLRFLAMAKGSLAELETQVMLVERLGLVGPAATDPVLGRITTVSLLLQALRKSLRNRLQRAAHSPLPHPHSHT